MQGSQVDLPHLFEIVCQVGFVSELLALGESITKIFKSISPSVFISLKYKVFPSWISTYVNSVMATSRPLKQRSGFPKASLPPAIAVRRDSFVIEVSGNYLIEIVCRFLRWVDGLVALALHLPNDLCNVGCRYLGVEGECATKSSGICLSSSVFIKDGLCMFFNSPAQLQNNWAYWEP